MEENYGFDLDNWEYFCSFARWYPDLFLDMIKPQKGGLNLHLDQRIYLRVMKIQNEMDLFRNTVR